MSEEFKIQKDVKRTMDLTPDDMDDINLDELKDINFDNELSDTGSLVFTKEKMSVPKATSANNFFNFGGQNKDSGKKDKPSTPKVHVNKDQSKTSAPPRVVPKRPIVEPDSMDLGLDMIANKQKKNVPKEESVDSRSESSRSSRASKRSLDLDFNELEKVKDIMDGASESSGSSGSSRSSASSLSDRIKDRVKSKTYANESERKQELLFLFDKLEKRGIKIPQKFTMRSSVEEMEKSYERLKNERDLQNSIKFQRRVLMGVVSTLEFVNHSVNPFDIDLDGWSESVMENYSEYDDIFEELYEKYKNKGHISPEVKLLMTLAGSAFYFHLSKMIIKPAQQKMQEMFGAMDGAGGGAGGMPDLGSMGGFMSGLMGGFMGPKGGNGGAGANGGNGKPASGGMRGPQGFDDILSRDSGSDIPSIAETPKGRSNGVKRTLNM